ncbi:hypothetical protein VKT23_016899 [Stygiomarasmius scandens]|uniref:Uncharacterized protein n=1 Tax=Marasmiellus scandens TaxID=2682957 RepID=A0ABR1IWM6_9AGAR
MNSRDLLAENIAQNLQTVSTILTALNPLILIVPVLIVIVTTVAALTITVIEMFINYSRHDSRSRSHSRFDSSLQTPSRKSRRYSDSKDHHYSDRTPSKDYDVDLLDPQDSPAITGSPDSHSYRNTSLYEDKGSLIHSPPSSTVTSSTINKESSRIRKANSHAYSSSEDGVSLGSSSRSNSPADLAPEPENLEESDAFILESPVSEERSLLSRIDRPLVERLRLGTMTEQLSSSAFLSFISPNYSAEEFYYRMNRECEPIMPSIRLCLVGKIPHPDASLASFVVKFFDANEASRALSYFSSITSEFLYPAVSSLSVWWSVVNKTKEGPDHDARYDKFLRKDERNKSFSSLGDRLTSSATASLKDRLERYEDEVLLNENTLLLRLEGSLAIRMINQPISPKEEFEYRLSENKISVRGRGQNSKKRNRAGRRIQQWREEYGEYS